MIAIGIGLWAKRALTPSVGARSQGHNTGLRGLAPRTRFPLNCRTRPLLGANRHNTVTTLLYRHLLRPSFRGSPTVLPGLRFSPLRSLARQPSNMRQLLWPFPSLLVSLPPMLPLFFSIFSRLHRFRACRWPGRCFPGQGRRHWVVPPPLPGRPGQLSLVDESRPHPRSLYRTRFAPPIRRLLVGLGGSWPSLS